MAEPDGSTPQAKLKTMGTVLIVDDDEDVEFVASCRAILAKLGYGVRVAAHAEVLQILANSDVDVVLTDLKWQGTIAAIRTVRADQLVVACTALPTVRSAIKAIRDGAFDYLLKPFSAEQLEVVVARAVEHRKLREENRLLRERPRAFPTEIGGLIGDSPAMWQVFELLRKIGRTQASVLICGERGTGKEACARALHQFSDRAIQKLVHVDCSRLPSGNPVESALEEADGGSIFLDEIGEMDVSAQGKLLRVLEERNFRRVGGDDIISVDVRVIAATHRDLEKEVSNGTFLVGLFHRLNVIRVDLPALRDRTGDLRLLAGHFARKFAPALEAPGNPAKEIAISADALAILESYHWPGNVKELQYVIYRAVSRCDRGLILPSDLPDALGERRLERNLPYDDAKQRWIEPLEREYLIELLKRYRNNVTNAAKAAGLDRKSIQRMMKKHGIGA